MAYLYTATPGTSLALSSTQLAGEPVIARSYTTLPTDYTDGQSAYPLPLAQQLGQKRYELANHLGNVLSVITDRRSGYESSTDSDWAWDKHSPVQVDQKYYFPYGDLMPVAGTVTEASYRFGFNGQEKVDEVNGSSGTHNTAQFWEYDTRIGVRWNRDPITMPWHSPYAVLNGNPIAFLDPQGDSPFGILGKFFRGIGNTLRGDSWSSRTSSRHVGKRNNEKPEGTSNWRGLLNVFRDLKLGAPAGRMVSQGWVGGGSGSFSNLSGNPIDRTATLNPYRELKDMYGTSRVTVTGLRVWGDADNWPTYAWMNSINRRGISEPLFASTATQLIATWPGSWWWLAGGDDAPKPPPGTFYFQTGFAPGLNALPTLEAGIFPAIFARVQLPVNLIHGLFGAWMGGAFNHKPLWTGDVWKLQFSAFSPNGGTLRYGYQYKARVWQEYQNGDRPWLSRLLYGY
jgi:RHS repeat-associated protein